jgi:hypothetical protein
MRDDDKPTDPKAASAIAGFVLISLAGFALVAGLMVVGMIVLLARAAP